MTILHCRIPYFLLVLWHPPTAISVEAIDTSISATGMGITSHSAHNNDNHDHNADESWPTLHGWIVGSGSSSSSGTDDSNTTLLLDLTRPSSPQTDRYRKYMKGCIDRYGPSLCLTNEEDRIAQNRNQPSLQKNFTALGYAKVKAPRFDLIQRFWYHTNDDAIKREVWDRGNIHTNHWESDTLLLDVEGNPGLPFTERRILVDEVQATLERWSGVPLRPTSLYGIRVYQKGSILAPHVDRLPLVLSAIINVAQDGVVEDWPLEFIGHDGRAINLTMQPGDMILYESHSVIHGRPTPFRGNYYANLFLHFEPVGYTLELERRLQSTRPSARERYDAAIAKHEVQRPERIPKFPNYIDEGTPEEMKWRQLYVFLKTDPQAKRKETQVTHTKADDQGKGTNVHFVAATGRLELLRQLAHTDPTILHKPDDNGWQPIHEAARSGHTKVLEYLIEHGADVNARTNQGHGASPLWWAEHMLPRTHPAIAVLRKHGAQSIAPGEKTKVSEP